MNFKLFFLGLSFISIVPGCIFHDEHLVLFAIYTLLLANTNFQNMKTKRLKVWVSISEGKEIVPIPENIHNGPLRVYQSRRKAKLEAGFPWTIVAAALLTYRIPSRTTKTKRKCASSHS